MILALCAWVGAALASYIHFLPRFNFERAYVVYFIAPIVFLFFGPVLLLLDLLLE